MILQFPDVIDPAEASELTAPTGERPEVVQAILARIRTTAYRHPLLNLALAPETFSPGVIRLVSEPVAEVNGERVDATVLVFLDSALSALCVDTGFGPVSLDAKAGSAVVLPPGSRTIEATDTRVADFWVTSTIRDAAQREIMYDLATSLQWLALMSDGDAGAEQRLRRATASLRQMWG